MIQSDVRLCCLGPLPPASYVTRVLLVLLFPLLFFFLLGGMYRRTRLPSSPKKAGAMKTDRRHFIVPYLSLATRSGVADRADALELSNAVETRAAIGARIRFTLVVLEVALGPAETCGNRKEKRNRAISSRTSLVIIHSVIPTSSKFYSMFLRLFFRL